MPRPIRIVHVITGLGTGGAEMMLWKLLGGTDRSLWDPAVISLRDRGTMAEPIEALGVPVHCLGVQASVPTPAAVGRLRRSIQALAPELLQGWMYHGNLAALVAGRWTPDAAVLWNVRHSVDDLRNEKWLTAALIRLGAPFSRRTAGIIYNSRTSARQHEMLGYSADRTTVIPNGFDVTRFRPVPGAGPALRKRLGVPDTTFLVGVVARYHPMKDYPNFLLAAAELRQRHDVRFVLAGRMVDAANPELAGPIERLGLRDVVHLLGEVADVPVLTAGLDVACSASAWGEGFPNAIGEAMACGVPCVVTDIGDSAWVVGDTGRVVPPRDASGLARAAAELLELPGITRAALGAAARARVVAEFSLDQIVARYQDLYACVARRS